jgi:nitrite reductase/ring-hydroxylating ferredoxin subunit
MPPEPTEEVDAAADFDLLDAINERLAWLEAHPDAEVGEHVRGMLEHIDTVHRVALTHLVEGIRSMAGDAFLNRLTADPAIRLLLMAYDLIAIDRRIIAEEALDAVRGHLHSRGIDIELDDVVGGTTYVRLHGIENSGIPVDRVRHDLEAALREGLVGFQQLELHGRSAAGSGLVKLGGLRRANRPVHFDVALLDEVAPGTMKAVEREEVPILLVNVEGDIFAVRNRCGESPLPLEYGTLTGAELRCPWHNCLYDVRSGRRLDGEPDRLAVYPVSIEDGTIRVALSVEKARADDDASRIVEPVSKQGDTDPAGG